jgi:hypothetical protein
MASPGDPQIEGWFPGLDPKDYQITSPDDLVYNCIAWAAGKTDAWWEPIRKPGYYWPDQAPWDDRIESVAQVFKLLGFEECPNAALEAGYGRVAIYGAAGVYTHVARQLPNGSWTSKLGSYKDIEHTTLEVLAGTEYGTVVKVLRRPVT